MLDELATGWTRVAELDAKCGWTKVREAEAERARRGGKVSFSHLLVLVVTARSTFRHTPEMTSLYKITHAYS